MTYPAPPTGEPAAPVPQQQQPAPKRRTALALAIVGGVVVLAAVAAAAVVALGGGKAGTAAAPTPSWSPITWQSQASQTATSQQYASAASPPIKSLRETYRQWQSDDCETGGSSGLCNILTETLKVEAETLEFALVGSAKPGVPAYIGDPPAEIAKLVVDTESAAQDANIVTGDQFTLSMFSLMSTLDRWDPYLG